MSETRLLWCNDQLESIDCELIPCQVHHTGEANVDRYFKPSISKSAEGDEFTASLRGRPLDGIKLDLSDKFSGILCSQEKDSKGHTELEAIGQFKSFRLWNLDSKPNVNDSAVRAVKWLDLSSAIHNKLSKEDLNDL